MTTLRAALTAMLGLTAMTAIAGTANAQGTTGAGGDSKPAPATDPAAAGDGQAVEMEEDEPPADIEGTAENPDAPKLPGDEQPVPEAAAPAPVRTGYPIEEVLRPITLPAVTSEVGLDVRVTPKDFNAEFSLRARYGITRQWQLGLRYAVGGLFDDPVDASDKTTFNTGKAFGLDLTYLVFDWLGARVTLPFYADPFASAITFGAPMKFRFGDKFAITALDDFLDVRIKAFVPSLIDERENALNAGFVDTNTETYSGNIHLRAGVIYQEKPNLAVKANFTQTFQDFSDNDNATGLEVIGQFSPSSAFDLTGRVGVDRLDRTESTFGVLIGAAYRI